MMQMEIRSWRIREIWSWTLEQPPFPVPLTPINPGGSLIYSGTVSGAINPVGDTDTYTLTLDAGQTISVVEQPSATGGSTLIPTLTLMDPGSNVIGNVTAGAAGVSALLQTIPVTTAGLYTIIVSAASGTTGNYTLGVTLNAALQTQFYDGASNNTLATAQNIDGSFISLGGGASRGAVLGTYQQPAGTTALLSNNFENGLQGFTIANTIGGLWHLSTGRGSQSGHSATTSLYFGQGEGPNGGGNYNTGARVAGTVTSPSIALPAGSSDVVNFNYVLQTEGLSSYDQAQLQVSTNGGASFSTLASYNAVAESSAWKSATPVSLSAFAGKTIQLRWSFDTIDSIANNFEGWYVDDVIVQPSTANNAYYAFSLNAGDSVTLALKGLSGVMASQEDLRVYNSAGALLASSTTGASNMDRTITDFAAPATGTYYIYTTGPTGDSYSLTLVKNADFDAEPNDTIATAQPFQSALHSGNEQVLGHIDSGNVDDYQVTLAAGVPATFSTATPGDGAGEPLNTLNPRLRLLNFAGAQVAIDDNSGPDGRNALINFTPVTGGKYYVEVSSTTATSTAGDYVLSVSGAVATPITVNSVSPANGSYTSFDPFTASFTCSSVILSSSAIASLYT